MALNLDDNLNNNSAGLQGLLTASHCLQPLCINSQPIAEVYTVETRPFARGKFATVRRCRHKETGISYAAKYIRKRRRAVDIRHEIMHEAYVLKMSTVCPRIVRLYEVFETSSEMILILEMAAGGDVQRVLDDEECMEEKDASRIVRQILEGLSFLHDHNVAHLDLKPQNVLLTSSFPLGSVKLCDFGISRLITKDTEIREIVGTPDYVAPEVLQYEPITLATDMWSVGVLTYVLLSGHSPFGGETKQETFCNITHSPLEFPPEMFAHISNDAKDFIQRLLVREPSERMTTKECLQHSWLCEQSISSKAISSLSSGSTMDLKNVPEIHHHQISVCAVDKEAEKENISTRVSQFSQQSKQKVKVTESTEEQKCSPAGNELNHSDERQVQQTSCHSRSVTKRETVVVEFEGISLGKRLMFSEEIILDERVGIVY